MKKYLLILFSLILLNSFTLADSLLESDYNFIDTAFDGIKPVTNKQFNDTVNKLTPQPVEEGFKGKLKAFLFGRKMGVEAQPNGQNVQMDIGGEKAAIDELKNGIYYIKLLVNVIGADGNIIPLGNYKIKEKNEDNQSYLVFYQGEKEYGYLKLKKYEDNLKKENDIAYSRVDIVSDDYVRIVYSTITDTKCALAKVYLQN